MIYRNWKSVPLPERMQKLPKDGRGYPVPVIVARDSSGTPKFQINNSSLTTFVLKNHLCAICGQFMAEGERWLVGGPLSAFEPNGAYIDTPTHYECLNYALQVCPYMAYTKYTKRIDFANIDPLDLGFLAVLDPSQTDVKVPFFVAVCVRSYTISRPDPFSRYLRPDKNYIAVEYWLDGEQITKEKADEILIAQYA